jgi:hypothetical protein
MKTFNSILLLWLLIVVSSISELHAQTCIEIRCPSDIIVQCNAPGGALVNFVVQATNHCDTNLVVTCEPPSGSHFPVGLTTVLCIAKGGREDIAHCSFLVEVQDTNPPTLNCPGNLVVTAQGVDGAMVDWIVTATDDCDTNVTVECEPPSGSFFPVGTSAVHCTATDDSGNQAFCGFLVTVRNPPALSISHQPPSNVMLRWHVPGTVEVATALSPLPDWKPAAGSPRTNDDERTLVYPLDRSSRFFRLAASPLAPPPDEDRDGVPDAVDKCPGTPPGLAVDEHGCSLIALTTRPESVAGEPMRLLSGLLDRMRPFLVISETVDLVEAELAEMDIALGLIRAGVTGAGKPFGVERFGGAVAGVRAAYSNLLTTIAGLERSLIANPPDTQGYGDVTPEDAEIMTLRGIANSLLRYLDQLQHAEDTLIGVADSFLGEGNLRGEIVEINDAERWIQLENGRRIGLPHRQFDSLIAVGSVVDLVVQEFHDGDALVKTVTAADTGIAFPANVLKYECLYLRIVPVQKFPPFSEGPFVLHHPEAYTHDDELWLEHGMRFAVENGNCGNSLAVRTDTFIRYRMKLDLYYKPINGNYQTVTLATSLGPDSIPVALPEDASTQPAVLTATLFRQECPVLGVLGSCSDPEVLVVKEYDVRVRPRFSYAEAGYDDTVFDLEDSPTEASFRSTRVNGFASVAGILDDVPNLHFLGLGYTVFGPQSSYPNLGFVQEESLPFAVYEFDLTDFTFFKELGLGTKDRSAIYWPRVTGFNNGRPFWYTCKLPMITRDAVALCGTPHSFYRLPFAGGSAWTISQGNFGSFTHTGWQSYAFDFPAAQGTEVRAARGGIVEDLVESFSTSNWNENQQQCTAFNHNYVTLRHQDGTTGNYIHMPQNGVLVSVGQKVRRGDVIALVGNTGCSTGPHLHFDVRNESGNNTLLSRFEMWNACYTPHLHPCPPLLPCIVPQPGMILFSNNKAWWE